MLNLKFLFEYHTISLIILFYNYSNCLPESGAGEGIGLLDIFINSYILCAILILFTTYISHILLATIIDKIIIFVYLRLERGEGIGLAEAHCLRRWCKLLASGGDEEVSGSEVMPVLSKESREEPSRSCCLEMGGNRI